MDECFAVDLKGEYGNELNVGDATYETVGVVQLYQNEFLPQSSNQVIVTRTSDMHPLVIDVQRSYEIKRQNQLARLTSNSVIQALPVNVNNEKHDYNDNSDAVLTVDSSQIPLTVQYCGQATQVNTPSPESDSDEERESKIQPVFDHEPDPDPPTSPINSNDMSNKCYMCFKKFRQKKNMYAHIRKIHSSQPNIQGGIICPLCKMHSLRQEHLRNHLETLHQVQIFKEERQFVTMQEFEDWKDFVEKETFSYYISKSSTKLLASNQTKTYYKCHRSGSSCSDKKPKKSSKKPTSYKIGATCPASMEVIENVQGITVTFWATHVGHNLLSKNECSRVKGLLSSGMSWDQVLDQVQREATSEKKPEKLDRSNQTKYVVMDKKIVSLGRKPKPNRLVRSVSQAVLIEKAENLFNFLERTEVTAAYRPIISSMIDNLASIVKRRAVSNNTSEKKNRKKRKKDILPLTDSSVKGDESILKERLRKKPKTKVAET